MSIHLILLVGTFIENIKRDITWSFIQGQLTFANSVRQSLCSQQL